MADSRDTEYAVIPVEALRSIHTRSNAEVVQAQQKVDPKMIRALEELVNAAKSQALTRADRILALGAAAW